MSFSNSTPKPQMKSFVTESELEEKRKIRQSEWEKVRKVDQPLECPDIPLDNRTLYDRLREQKVRDEEEKEEAKKMKNFVRGLESDEVEFLDQVDDIYTKLERKKLAEEREVLREFKESVASFTSTLSTVLPVSSSKRKDAPGGDSVKKKSQKELLSSLVRIKRHNSQDEESTTSSTDTVPISPTPSATASKPSLLVAEYGSSDSD